MKNIIHFDTRFTNYKTLKALVLKFRTALASLKYAFCTCAF